MNSSIDAILALLGHMSDNNGTSEKRENLEVEKMFCSRDAVLNDGTCKVCRLIPQQNRNFKF
jgi:hypothetical protein